MKKSVLFSVMAAMILFAGCKKDGVYNPAKKISKITLTETKPSPTGVDVQTQVQNWTWNKNQLQNIVYTFIGSDDTWTEEFSYDKSGRLIRVENKEDNVYAVYEYDGDRLDKVLYFDGNEKAYEYNLKYKDDRLSEIECVDFDIYRSIKKENKLNPLAFVCSSEIADLAQKAEENVALTESQPRQKMSAEIWVMSLEWNEANISKIAYDYPDVNRRYEYLLTYDNKVNPLAGFFGLNFWESYDINHPYSRDYIYKNANNIVSMISVGDTWKREYNYTYTGQYPVSYTYTDSYSDGYYHTHDCKIEYK